MYATSITKLLGPQPRSQGPEGPQTSSYHILWHYDHITGGWWYNNCAAAHLTGIHTESRTRVGQYKQISYQMGGDRMGDSESWESWKEAEMKIIRSN